MASRWLDFLRGGKVEAGGGIVAWLGPFNRINGALFKQRAGKPLYM
jgi:hypothetical protein